MKEDSQTTIKFVEDLKRRWMATVDALIDPLMIVTKDYVITKANKALAAASSADIRKVVGQKCHKVFANLDHPCPGCEIQKAVANHKHHQYELENVHPGRYHEVTSQPVYDSEGNLEGVVQVYRDRTEARNLQAQLLQNEKLASIGLLAGGIAHEINNPLAGILIFSQMLLKEMDKKSPHYEDVVEIEAATQRCKAIVENLLDFARKQPAPGRKQEVEDVDLEEAVKSALKFSQVGRIADHIDIQEEWCQQKLVVKGNRNKAIQLFLNLIQNAIQAMPNGGLLILRSSTVTRQGSRCAAIEVADNGVGISPENLKRIFDPFFTSKAAGEGTGLGLSICHGIAEDFRGTIEVQSHVNQGSVFRLVVPLENNVTLKASA